MTTPVGMTSRLFRMALSGVIAVAPLLPAYAEVIVDPTAPQAFRPSLGNSSTGVPVVNIVAPTAGGVSHNKFSDYDIGSTGLIHNNSLASGTAKLGGTVGANPNFSGATATTIVNEVTTSNTSLLAGRAEVFGDKAGLIIANPNGITCNGCGALNTSRFTLTTGVPAYDSGNNDSLYFDVTGGLITIDGNGLEGLDVPEASVIARQIVLSGYVSDALRLDLVSGGIRYDYSPTLGGDVQSAITEQSLSNAGITYQIDASTLSSVSAGKINIIGNDDGVGVRIQGDVTASASDLVIDADGNLTISSNLSSERDTTITTGGTAASVTSSGTIDADRDLSITTTGAVTNSGTLQASRRLTIDADGDVTNSGTATATQVMISDAADVTNSGSISAGLNELLFTATGDEATLAALSEDIAAAINSNEGFQGFHAYIPVGTTPGVIYISIEPPYYFADMDIDVTVPVTGSDTQTFTYTSTGPYTGRLDITGLIEANDQFKIQAYGDVTIGSSSNRVGSLTNSGSNTSIDGYRDIAVYASGGITNSSSAEILTDGSINLDSSGGAVTQDATVTSGGATTLTGASVTNGGTTTAAGALTIDSDGNLTVGGTLQADSINVTDAAAISNTGTIAATNAVTVASSGSPATSLSNSGSGAEISGSTVTIYTSGALSNSSSASITADQTVSLTSSGGTLTQDAVVTGGQNVTLSGSDLSIGSGSGKYTRAADTLSLIETGSGSDFTYAGQSLTGNTAVSFEVVDLFDMSSAYTAPGDISITAGRVTTGYNLVAGDDLTITTTGDVTNNAVIYAANGTSGGSGLVISAGGQIVNSANTNIYGAGDVVLVSDSRITNNSGAYIEAGNDLTLAVVTGETISGGEITNTPTKAANGYILNTQGYITATNDFTAITSNLYNMRDVTVNGSGPWTIDPNDVTTTTYSNGWGSSIYGKVINALQNLWYRKLVSDQAITGTSSSIYAGGDITLNATSIRNRLSTIEAAGNLTVTGTTLNNESASLLTVNHYKQRWGTQWYGDINIEYGSDTCTSGTSACFSGAVDQPGWIPETTTYSTNTLTALRAGGTLSFNSGTLAQGQAQSGLTNTGYIEATNVLVSARNIQNGLTPGTTVGVSNPGNSLSVSSRRPNAISLTPTSLSNLSALYTINAPGTSQYLLSASIDLAGNTLTPDYLISQLSASAGNTGGLQFLADPFVENRLLQEATLAATGRNFLLDDVENDQTAQRQALYDNAIAFASTDSTAQIGTALTETQIASLDAPLLWYVTETIDGIDVLVPTLYLPTPDAIEVAPTGQIVASNNLLLDAEDTVTNTGSISAGGTVLVQAENVVNETLTTIASADVAEGTVAYITAGPSATISGSNVFIQAQSDDPDGGNVTNTGGVITNTSADGQTVVQASGNVINQVLVTQAVEDIERGNLFAEYRDDYSIREDYTAGVIGGEGNVSVISTGGDVINDASTIASSDGDVLIFAEGSFLQNNRTDTFVTENSVSLGGGSSTSSSSSASSSGSGYDDFEANAQASVSGSQDGLTANYSESVYNQSASVSGQNVTIVANTGNIESIGSSIASAGNTILQAVEGDVTLQTDSVVTNSSSLTLSLSGNASAEAGGSGIDYNATAQASGTVGLDYGEQQNATFITSTVSGNNVIIDAGNDINSIGAQVSAAENLSLIAANDINSIAQQELLENFSFSASNTTTAYATAGTTAGQFGTPDAAVGIENTTSIGVGGGTSTSSATSGFSAGGNLSLQAGNNITLVGTDLTSGGDTILQAANDISISALQETSSSFGFSASSSVGAQLGSGGLSPTASNSFGVSTSSAVTNQEANVTTGGNFVAVAGGSTTLAGVNVNAGGDTLLQGTTVTVTSVQDQFSGTSFGFSSSPLTNGTGSNSSFSAASDAPLSASFSQTESLTTTDQAQLNTGGSLNIVTTEGAATLASVNANIGGNLNAQIADGSDLNVTDLQDTTSSTGFSVDIAIEANAAEAIAGTVEGVVEAIETGDVAGIVSSIPGANQVASTIAAIESGDGAAILGALGGPGVGALAQQINGATGGALNGQGTGTNFGQSFLDAAADTQPAVDVASLQGAVDDAGTVDVRLGAQFTETNTTTSVGSTINVGGSANISANNLNLTGSNLNVTGDSNLDLAGSLNVTAGVNTFDSFSAGGGVTVGFDAVNQDVRVGVDGNYSDSSATTFTNAGFTTGGTLNANVAEDVNIVGGNVQAGDINGVVGGSVNVVTLQNTTQSQSFEGDLMVEVGVTGDSGGGELNFQGSQQSGQSDAQQSTFLASGNSNLVVGGDLNLVSGIIGAGNNNNLQVAGNINASANVNTNIDDTFGGSLSVSANQQGEDSGAGGGGSLDVNVNLNEANNVGAQSLIVGGNNNNIQVGGDANLIDTQVIGTNGNVQIGGDLTVATTQSTTSNFGLEFGLEASGSSASEGGDGEEGSGGIEFGLEIGDSATTGAQAGFTFSNNLDLTTGGDASLTNAQIIAGNNANVNIGGELTITAVQDTENQLGIGFEAGGGGEEGSANQGNFGVDFNLVDSNLNAAQSGISAGGNLALTTGGDTTLTGAVIQGGTVDANIGGDLTVTTLQEDEFSLALNLEAGGSSEGAGSGSFGAGIDLTDRTETTTVAGIAATNGNANVTVAGDTTLTGASITAQGGQATLDTQSLTVTDLASSSLSLSAGIGGGIDASSIDGEDTEALEVLGAAQEAGGSAPNLNFELSASSGTTTGGVGDGATVAGTEGSASASETANAVLSSLQQQIATASESGGSNAPQGVSAEALTEKLGTLQASASTTAFEAQQAAADIFNDGDPASAEALDGLSPNQAVLMLQAARVWLTPDQQAQIDIAIQQIVTGTEPATSSAGDDN